MKCPNCNVALVMSERQGIEIDYCPDCRGVWLDRGELDKIVQRSTDDSAPAAAPTQPAAQPTPPPQGYPQQGYPAQGYPQQGHGKHGYKRRKSWLEEIFD